MVIIPESPVRTLRPRFRKMTAADSGNSEPLWAPLHRYSVSAYIKSPSNKILYKI